MSLAKTDDARVSAYALQGALYGLILTTLWARITDHFAPIAGAIGGIGVGLVLGAAIAVYARR